MGSKYRMINLVNMLFHTKTKQNVDPEKGIGESVALKIKPKEFNLFIWHPKEEFF